MTRGKRALHVWLPRGLMERLDRYAEERGITRTGAVVMLVEASLRRLGR